MCEYIDHNISLVSLYLPSLLKQRWLSFLAIDMSCHLINGGTSLENNVIDLTHSVSLALDCFSLLLFLSSWLIHSYDYEIMQLPITGGTLCVLPNVTT